MELDCLLDKINSEELKKTKQTKTKKKTREHKQNDGNPWRMTLWFPVPTHLVTPTLEREREKKNSWWKKGRVRCHVTTPLHFQTTSAQLWKSLTSRFPEVNFFFFPNLTFPSICAPPPPIFPPLFPLILLPLVGATPPWSCWSGCCWSTCPWPRTAGRRRCARRWSRRDWRSGSRSGSSWRTAPPPRCVWRTEWRRRFPRSVPGGCRLAPSAAGSTSTWWRWRWWSWLSTRRRSCRSLRAQQSRPQSLPEEGREGWVRKCGQQISLELTQYLFVNSWELSVCTFLAGQQLDSERWTEL